jgi:hypothetical protein
MARQARMLLKDPGRWREQRLRGIETARSFTVARAVDVVESVLLSL